MRQIYSLSKYIDALRDDGLLVECKIEPKKQQERVVHLTYDSRDVKEGTLFIAKGVAFKDEYLLDAMRDGAFAYVAERYIGSCADAIIVNDIRGAMATLSKLFNCNVQDKLTTFAITGTKGKTTTLYYLKAILDRNAEVNKTRECAYSSSVEAYDGVAHERATNTTPESPEIWRHFFNATESGIDSFILEVSSQALKYKRVEGIEFSIGVFTNIENDHISEKEHPDFEDYFTSKLMLFDRCRVAVVNTDSRESDRVLAYIDNKIPTVTYGTAPTATVRCTDSSSDADGSEFTVTTPIWSLRMKIGMPGEFNISNALAAIAMAYVVGIPPQIMAEAVVDAKAPGRMELFKSRDEQIYIFVDYAHNKPSFEKICRFARREYPERTLVMVFGAHGDKAKNRRREMGEVISEYCDYAVIAEQDPATESYLKIANEILEWTDTEKCHTELIEYRPDALRHAVFADIGKRIILMVGHGVQKHMAKEGGKVPYPSDVETAAAVLAEYDAVHIASLHSKDLSES